MDNKQNAPDIINKEHYFNKYMMFRRIDERKKQSELNDNEVSMDLMCETKYGEAKLCVNKHGELYAIAESDNPEFAWMELFTNKKLYEVIVVLTDDEKHLLTLKIHESMSFKEIADELQITARAAECRYQRIISKLKKFL